jgi:hypothetical protein
MDWSRLPRKFPTDLMLWANAPRGREGTRSYGHDLTHELPRIGSDLDRAAVQLAVSQRLGAAGLLLNTNRLLTNTNSQLQRASLHQVQA